MYKMNDVIEFKAPIDVIDHDLDRYDSIDFFPEKTKRLKHIFSSNKCVFVCFFCKSIWEINIKTP